MPLKMAAAIAQLLRDLLECDPQDVYLGKRTTLDQLILLEMLTDRSPSLRRFSEKLATQVHGWIEQMDGDRPVLYREWIHGAKGSSRVEELTGSLGLICDAEEARRLGHLAVFKAVVVDLSVTVMVL